MPDNFYIGSIKILKKPTTVKDCQKFSEFYLRHVRFISLHDCTYSALLNLMDSSNFDSEKIYIYFFSAGKNNLLIKINFIIEFQ